MVERKAIKNIVVFSVIETLIAATSLAVMFLIFGVAALFSKHPSDWIGGLYMALISFVFVAVTVFAPVFSFAGLTVGLATKSADRRLSLWTGCGALFSSILFTMTVYRIWFPMGHDSFGNFNIVTLLVIAPPAALSLHYWRRFAQRFLV
jgi:hypothetical protein